ncbi:MAG: hypothetical protein ORN26_02515 [Candidatus Pacebacteria bacterium]|nr:hypothetical protein [Candidatus Paceibacterota bacterium]
MPKQILKQLRELIRTADLNNNEVLAFENGIFNLSIEEQVQLYRLLNEDRELIYPTFVNYMAKKTARETGIGWSEAVEAELKFLENYINRKRVGDEIK